MDGSVTGFHGYLSQYCYRCRIHWPNYPYFRTCGCGQPTVQSHAQMTFTPDRAIREHRQIRFNYQYAESRPEEEIAGQVDELLAELGMTVSG